MGLARAACGPPLDPPYKPRASCTATRGVWCPFDRRPTSPDHFPAGTSTDQVAVEEPVEIRVDGEPLAVTMRTPGDDPDLAAGFCLTEGVIDHPDELERAEACTLADYGNVVLVTLAGPARDRWREQAARLRRDLYLSSSCGLCGTQTIDRIARRISPLDVPFTISVGVLVRLPETMMASQAAFARTGGLHAAVLFAPDGRLRLLREDVGRHNAVDKLIGGLLLSGQLPAGPGYCSFRGGRASNWSRRRPGPGSGPGRGRGPVQPGDRGAERFGMTLVGF